MLLEYFTHTEKGPRLDNEDAIGGFSTNAHGFFCVADGVGGSNCGGKASSMSVERFMTKAPLEHDSLESLLLEIHEDIVAYQKSHAECKGMATTFTGCFVSENKITGIHVGDSKLCVLRGNGIKQLSEPHTEANRLYKAGKLTKNEYLNYPRKNIIESALGANNPPTIQIIKFDLEKGDRLLLTTDGIHELISKKEFRDMSISTSNVTDFGKAILELIGQRKLTDNASFITVAI